MTDAVIDACCLINCAVTDRIAQIVSASKLQWHIPPSVLAEAVYVRSADDADPLPAAEMLQPCFDAGILRSCSLLESERELFVTLAQELDDGEAMALAIAARRRWKLATDDRKAIRLAESHNVNVITTPELLHRWAESGGPSPGEVGAVLQRVTHLARFTPHPSSPLYDWWTASAGRAQGH